MSLRRDRSAGVPFISRRSNIRALLLAAYGLGITVAAFEYFPPAGGMGLLAWFLLARHNTDWLRDKRLWWLALITLFGGLAITSTVIGAGASGVTIMLLMVPATLLALGNYWRAAACVSVLAAIVLPIQLTTYVMIYWRAFADGRHGMEAAVANASAGELLRRERAFFGRGTPQPLELEFARQTGYREGVRSASPPGTAQECLLLGTLRLHHAKIARSTAYPGLCVKYSSTRPSMSDMVALRKLKLAPVVELDLSGLSTLGDDYVPPLVRISTLRLLDIRNTGITAAGADKLRNSLPAGCELRY